MSDIFYCAESVLLPEYRGRGVGSCILRRTRGPCAQTGICVLRLLQRDPFARIIRPDPPTTARWIPSGGLAATPRWMASWPIFAGKTWMLRRKPRSRCNSGRASFEGSGRVCRPASAPLRSRSRYPCSPSRHSEPVPDPRGRRVPWAGPTSPRPAAVPRLRARHAWPPAGDRSGLRDQAFSFHSCR